MLENNAKQWIEYISSFRDYPEGLSKEDWVGLRALIEIACGVVNEGLRKRGLEAMCFFDRDFLRAQKD